MGISGAAVFNSAVDQMQSSARNLEAIRQARRKREEEDQQLDLDKKKAQIALEESQIKNQGTVLKNKLLEAQINEYYKQQKSANTSKDSLINVEEQKQTQTGMMAKTVARQVFNEDPALQNELAMRLNPARAQVPGPQGGMVQGMQEPQDTPEAVPSAYSNMPEHILEPNGKGGFKEGKPADFALKRIKALKAQGAPLLPAEEEALFKESHPTYNRNTVLTRARQMALDDAKSKYGNTATPDQVLAMIPKAEEMLYGASVPRKSATGKGVHQSITPLKNPITGDNPNDKHKVGDTQVTSKGTYKYTGNNKWVLQK